MTEYLQGETITFTLVGDDKIDLDLLGFTVSVYPKIDLSKVTKILKSSAIKISTNTYQVKVQGEITKEMIAGAYNVEVLNQGIGGTDNLISIKESAFMIKASASKTHL